MAGEHRAQSLGDFTLVNLARSDLGDMTINEGFYRSMLQALVAVQAQIASLSQAPGRVILACSGADDEVAYVWAPASGA